MIRPDKLTPEQQLRSRRMFMKFCLLNGFSYMCLGDTVILLFAVKIHCPDVLIAILGAMVYVGFLMMPLGKIMTARLGAAQSLASFWILRNVSALLAASASVFTVLGLHGIAMGVLLSGAFLFYGFRAAGTVMGTPLIGEITTAENRNRFLADTASGFHLTSLAALFLISGVLRISPSLWVLTGVIFVGSMFGITASRMFRMVDESPEIRDSAKKPVSGDLGHVWRNSAFRSYLLAVFAINTATILLAPISMLTLKRGCGVSDTNALLFSLIQFGSAILLSQFAGKVSEKIGERRVVILSYFLLINLVWFWIFMPEPYSPWLAGIPFFLIGSATIAATNAESFYFLRSLPVRLQVTGSMMASLITGALAGLAGMGAAAGIMYLAERLTRGAANPYTLYRVYFMLAFAMIALLTVYPVLRLKKISGYRK